MDILPYSKTFIKIRLFIEPLTIRDDKMQKGNSKPVASTECCYLKGWGKSIHILMYPTHYVKTILNFSETQEISHGGD